MRGQRQGVRSTKVKIKIEDKEKGKEKAGKVMGNKEAAHENAAVKKAEGQAKADAAKSKPKNSAIEPK